VRWVGPKPYELVPRYVAAFDVALIPYVSNVYTRSCFPLKTFEYLAAGKAIVASGLPELGGMEPDVVLADDATGFLAAIDEALLRDTESDRKRRMELAAANTWESRASRLLGLIETELEQLPRS
jgi:glycosyltransferase involved in cell wall biosynthesis